MILVKVDVLFEKVLQNHYIVLCADEETINVFLYEEDHALVILKDELFDLSRNGKVISIKI